MFKTSKYLQKIVTRIPLESEIYSFAVQNDNEIYACTSDGLVRFNGVEWSTLHSNIIFNRIITANDGRVFASAGTSLYEISSDGATLIFDFPEEICGFCDNDKIIVVTENGYYLPADGGYYQDHTHPIEQKPEHIVALGDKVCLVNYHCLQRLEGKRKTWRCIFHDHSTMPDIKINCAEFDKLGNLLVGTDTGLYIYDYKSTWLSKKEIPVFCVVNRCEPFFSKKEESKWYNDDVSLGTEP